MSKLGSKALGQRLRELRTTAELSQEKLGDMLGVTDRHIRRFEKGDYLPGTAMLVKLADLYHMSAEELVDGNMVCGIAEVVRRLKPYVVSHITAIGERSRRLQEELLAIKMTPNPNEYDYNRMRELEEQVDGALQYLAEAWKTLNDCCVD